jgi:hypothetical protein
MNSSSQSTTNSSAITALTAANFTLPITLTNLITNIYMMPIGSVIGFILNIPCLIVLFHRKLKGDTYKYLIFKTLSHLGLLFIVAMTPVFKCTTCPISLSLFANLVRYYLNLCVLNPLSTYAALVEIALSYDRLLMLKQQKSKCLIRLKFWPTCICFTVFGFIVNLPYMLSFQIESLEGTNIWLYLPTGFYNTTFYRMYVIVFNLIQALLALIVLVVLNILVKIEFSKYIERKKNLTNSKSTTNKAVDSKANKLANNQETESLAVSAALQSKQNNLVNLRAGKQRANANREKSKDQNESAELNFTLMILVSSVFFSATRLFQFINIGSFMIFQQLGIISPLSPYIAFSSYISVIFYYGSNLFTYLFFNKVFRGCFKEIFYF